MSVGFCPKFWNWSSSTVGLIAIYSDQINIMEKATTHIWWEFGFNETVECASPLCCHAGKPLEGDKQRSWPNFSALHKLLILLHSMSSNCKIGSLLLSDDKYSCVLQTQVQQNFHSKLELQWSEEKNVMRQVQSQELFCPRSSLWVLILDLSQRQPKNHLGCRLIVESLEKVTFVTLKILQ